MKEKITLKTLLKKDDTEAHIYVIGLIVMAILLAVWGILKCISLCSPISFGDFCVLNRLTGFYCPGCGGTRALLCLIHGDIISSFIYHPAVLYFSVLFIIFYASQTLRYVTHGRIHGLKYHKIYLIIGIVLLIGNCLLKNILLGFFHIKVL